jgi:PAS domain S-box-containing protein
MLLLVGAWLLSTNSRLVNASYDSSQAWLARGGISNPPVAIVYLDVDSYLREKQSPTGRWSRGLHAQLLRRLTKAGVRAVVFDIIFDGPGEDPRADEEFVSAIRDNGHAVLAGEISPGSRVTGGASDYESLQLSKPEAMFANVAAAWGVANLRVDDDFVVRRQFSGLPGFEQPSLAFATAKMLGLGVTNAGESSWFRYYGRPLALPHVSYSAALHADEVGDDFFRGKTIFVGARPITGTILERKDEFRSPLASWGDRDLFMPAVEVHATQMLNIIQGDSLSRLPPWAELLLLALIAGGSAGMLFWLRPLAAGGAALVLESGVIIAAMVLLTRGRIWFPWLIPCAVQIPGALAGSVLFQSLDWYRQKRKFEAQRRADELKIREQAALIEKAQDAIFVEDLAGNIVYANPSAEKLYGWSDAAQKAFTTNEARLAEARQTAATRGEWLGEFEQVLSNGKKIAVTSRCTLIRDDLGAPKSLLFINTDVTEKKNLELEFLRAQRIESIGVIAGGIAHDLNNSLSPVLMGLQMLRHQRDDEETRRMLTVMEDNTHRSADMVRQVLLFSRGREGEKEPLSPGALLREIERVVRQTFPRNINIATLVPTDLWPVLGNATQLHQVLLNLCVNARDAMPSGGQLTLAADNVELDASEAGRIANARPGRFVMLLVSDNGAGIPREILPRVFEPFFTTKPVGQGTGLGLATTARIVAQHEGFFSLKSEPSEGTVFEIYLPVASIAPTASRATENPVALPTGAGELILVVDDEQSVREMISLALTAQNFRAVTAANGAEAVALVQQKSDEISLVLLDDDMPVMTGRSALPKLRSCAPSLKIILMSGDAQSPAQTDGVATLNKPFQLEELLQVVSAGVA